MIWQYKQISMATWPHSVLICGKSICHDPNLRLVTKIRAWKSAGQECNPGVTLILSEVQGNVREWAHTLPNGFPFWELDSRWTLEFSKSDLKGENSLDWKVLYTIEKLLRCKCLKWAHMIHLNAYNTSYG